MNEFGERGDWNAMAHVRFLRAQGGASSGFTADLIEKLYLALEIDRRNLRHWREECGKLHAQIASIKWKSDIQNDQVTISLDHYSALVRDHQKLTQLLAVESLPSDGSCLRCGSAPRNASGLCATCVDEDAVRAGEVDIEECGNHSAGSPPR